MSILRYGGLLATLWALCLISPVQAQVADVWAVDDGEKVFRYEADHFARSGNGIWDGETIELRGLRNEVLGFQVIVVADSNGASTAEIDIKPPVHTETGTIIGAAGGHPYSADGGVALFSQS